MWAEEREGNQKQIRQWIRRNGGENEEVEKELTESPRSSLSF